MVETVTSGEVVTIRSANPPGSLAQIAHEPAEPLLSRHPRPWGRQVSGTAARLVPPAVGAAKGTLSRKPRTPPPGFQAGKGSYSCPAAILCDCR